MFQAILPILYMIFLAWLYPFIDGIYHINYTVAEFEAMKYGFSIFFTMLVIDLVVMLGGACLAVFVGRKIDNKIYEMRNEKGA